MGPEYRKLPTCFSRRKSHHRLMLPDPRSMRPPSWPLAMLLGRGSRWAAEPMTKSQITKKFRILSGNKSSSPGSKTFQS